MSEKQGKFQSRQLGGKGTPRRKTKKSSKGSSTDDKKIQSTMKKLHAQPIPGIEVVNMFKDDGTVIHIPAPHVQASVPCNTFCISGPAQEKDLADLIPGILNQLGPDNIASLRRLAETYQQKMSMGKEDELPETSEP